MNLSPLTIERLRIVAKHITEEPELYDQRSVDELDRDCGCPACIFGWAVSLWPDDVMPFDGLLEAGAAALGMSPRLCDKLFDQWPIPFGAEYTLAATEAEKAVVAVRRIERFIASDGVI